MATMERPIRSTYISLLPTEPGVYRFRDDRDRILYIGRTVDLRRRVASYWGRLTDRRHLRRMVPQIVRIEALVCASEHEAAWLERNLLEQSKPRWNRSRGGQEVPVYLRLTERSASAALSVVHEGTPDLGGRLYGPYLGGHQARLAVAALHRVLPLAYAGDRLTGSERDMARVRGFAQLDRSELVGAVAAVLDRDPDAVAAVRDRLFARRDDAAAALVFELAARIQAEIEAVEWVVATQGATVPGPVRADVHAWADGVLVGFQVRNGRLRTWTQRPCDESAAAALVGATPQRWQHFARRNAELAARLTRVQAPAVVAPSA
jgi:excinuclease ABC subunit C